MYFRLYGSSPSLSQQASTFTQGYPKAYMVKVKSQGEALRLYNASLKAKDVEVVRRAPHVVRYVAQQFFDLSLGLK